MGGTLTEGGATLIEENIAIVKTLATRGIMSSICSKNDFGRVETVLREAGIWDYFIFPSINWDPKGPRLKALIEAVQLRPPTVLFIDDNSMNLNEAKHFIPDLQVSDETIIGGLLENPLLRGKDDSSLSRLAQYKVLEQKKHDSISAGGDNDAFLRSSDIRVHIDNPDLLIDRVIELVNRTNQLNFTKKRFSEAKDTAQEQVTELLAKPGIEAGVVRVVDKYGDYGHIGFYAVDHSTPQPELIHFCFSCRTLNMGIENWVYQHLGRPALDVVGEVIGDVHNDNRPIDWIRLVGKDAADEHGAASGPRPFNKVIFRGGCEQRSFSHFFTNVAEEVIGEFNLVRDDIVVRPDHSNVFRMAAEGVPQDYIEAAKPLGFDREDVTSAVFEPADGKNLAILSFWGDARYPTYRHRQFDDLRLPVPDAKNGNYTGDSDRVRDALVNSYEYAGLTSEEEFKHNLRIGFARIPDSTHIIVILPRRYDGNGRHLQNFDRQGQWIRDLAKEDPRVSIFLVDDFIQDSSEVLSNTHFKRDVYFRMFQKFVEQFAPALPQEIVRNARKGRVTILKEKLALIDTTSRAAVEQFYLENKDEVLQSAAFAFRFARLLKNLGFVDEAVEYWTYPYKTEYRHSPAMTRSRIVSLLQAGRLADAEAVAKRVLKGDELAEIQLRIERLTSKPEPVAVAPVAVEQRDLSLSQDAISEEGKGRVAVLKEKFALLDTSSKDDVQKFYQETKSEVILSAAFAFQFASVLNDLGFVNEAAEYWAYPYKTEYKHPVAMTHRRIMSLLKAGRVGDAEAVMNRLLEGSDLAEMQLQIDRLAGERSQAALSSEAADAKVTAQETRNSDEARAVVFAG